MGTVPGVQRRPGWIAAGLMTSAALAAVAVAVLVNGPDDRGVAVGSPTSAPTGPGPQGSPAEPSGSPTSPDASSSDSTSPVSAGGPAPGWPGATTVGMLTFRGNPTRTFYGVGPVPRTEPKELWRFPSAPMCARSQSKGETKVWCGTGWTGQANLWVRADGTRWLMFGAYDDAYHFLDADTGRPVMDPLPTGDINKGSATLDPDGFPLYYAGSRDNYLRVIALDRGTPTVLWKLAWNAVSPIKWNSDWDGAPLVIGDYLFEGGENSQIHVVKLNRAYGADGKVTVDPQLVWHAPGWDAELLRDIGDEEVSIENSVAISNGTMYFANSGGLVQGWDISGIEQGRMPTRTFRFWTGDDTDASVVIDADGFLYVASEYQRGNARAREVGQLMKLDPRKPDDPLVWSWKDRLGGGEQGIWSTPALHAGTVITTTNSGRVLALDAADGTVLWTKQLGGPVWQSPVVVDDVLLQGDCKGWLRAYDVRDPRTDPPLLWEHKFDGCVESTPTVWNGTIWVGTRDGFMHALG